MTGKSREPQRPPQPRGYEIAKRLLDLTLGSLALIVSAPVFLLTALVIKLDSSGPVLFRQTRIGVGGRPFVMVKFRTMIVTGDDSLHRSYYQRLVEGTAEARENDEGESVFLLDDPRVTRVGAYLRRTSLDELPNLFNVLKGDMSLVGPRPPIPYEVDLYDERAKGKLEVKPGMTGLAQISGRGALTFAEVIDRDLEYIERRSFGFDLLVLLKTLPVVLTRRGV